MLLTAGIHLLDEDRCSWLRMRTIQAGAFPPPQQLTPTTVTAEAQTFLQATSIPLKAHEQQWRSARQVVEVHSNMFFSLSPFSSILLAASSRPWYNLLIIPSSPCTRGTQSAFTHPLFIDQYSCTVQHSWLECSEQYALLMAVSDNSIALNLRLVHLIGTFSI